MVSNIEIETGRTQTVFGSNPGPEEAILTEFVEHALWTNLILWPSVEREIMCD
jgi:hypothetical protein